MSLESSMVNSTVYPSPPFFTFFVSVLDLCFVGRISDSVIRQDHAILLGYAALTQPTYQYQKQQA